MNERAKHRREFLCQMGRGVAALLSGGAGILSSALTYPQGMAGAAPSRPGHASLTTQNLEAPVEDFIPDMEIALAATPAEMSLLPGTPTRVWMYRGEVVNGDKSVLQTLPGSYLGPTFRLKNGQNVRVHFRNGLPESSIVHWHGLHVPQEADGHPRLAIEPGRTYLYDFKVINRAGTYWYHPHPHTRTGSQVYRGMAGLLLVSDDEEAAAGLPSGEQDIPLVIQDRIFDGSNQLVYRTGGMMDQMIGFLGNRILVNGRVDFSLP